MGRCYLLLKLVSRRIIGARTVLAAFLLLVFVSPAVAEWHFYVSPFASLMMHSEFPSRYDTFQMRIGNIVTNQLFSVKYVRQSSKPGLGFSVGFTTNSFFDFPQEEKFKKYFYGELAFVPALKYSDASETEIRSDGSTQQTIVALQSDRRCYAIGGNFGVVMFPIKKLPVGIDVSAGLHVAKQQFVSGTWKQYGYMGMATGIGEDQWDYAANSKYDGHGKWTVGDLGLVAGLGLHIVPSRSWSADLMFRPSFVVTRSRKTGLIYVPSGEQQIDSTYGIGRLLSAGVTYYF
jgi:hypothetical protein